jgi:predicted DsbA family dithiol-disulfide isomerase
VQVTPGTLVVFSDIACPWAYVAVHRLHAGRRRLGLEREVRFDHRAFALELANERPTPKLTLDAEVPVAGALAPDADWQLWLGDPHAYPVSTLLALEAVQAAKEQGLEASEALDLGLRRAFFGQSRCVTMLHVILEVAGECGLDVAALERALQEGGSRPLVHVQHRRADGTDEVKGSPHVFAPGGLDAHNPGVTMHWEGGHDGTGFPVVDHDDPTVIDDLLRAASVSRK